MAGFFEGRQLVIASMHQKEQVLKPLLEAGLKVTVSVAIGLNTDLLGTFSGEVARIADPLTTARKKCELAMQLIGCDLAIASEGSFGPHPSAFFLPANEEWLLLIDRKHQLEIHARHLSTATNFAGQEFSSLEELEAFASTNGPDFYGLPRNSGTITLQRQSWQLPESVPFDGSQLIPLGAGTSLNWKLSL